MAHISGFARDQLLLLPEAVDDYVDVDNPVRFIDAFVDGLDLAAVGFTRVAGKATGRPGYAPGDLLKLYILRLPQPGPIEPTAGARVSLQRRGRLVAWRLEARL
jgi:transposase